MSNIIAVRALQTPTAKPASTNSSASPLRVNDPNSNQSSLSLPVLLIFVVILSIIAFIIAYRLFRLKRQSRPFRHFFVLAAKSSKSRPNSMSEAGLLSFNASNMANSSTPSIMYPSVTTPPATHAPSRIRAADVDSGGRRLGIPDLEQGQVDFNELPVYEKAGGPPNYGGLGGPPQYFQGEITPCRV